MYAEGTQEIYYRTGKILMKIRQEKGKECPPFTQGNNKDEIVGNSSTNNFPFVSQFNLSNDEQFVNLKNSSLPSF